MKLTRKILIEMIRQELKENAFSKKGGYYARHAFPMILTTKHTGSQINTQSHLSRWKIIIMIICTIQAPQNKKLEKILQAISTTIAMSRVN